MDAKTETRLKRTSRLSNWILSNLLQKARRRVEGKKKIIYSCFVSCLYARVGVCVKVSRKMDWESTCEIFLQRVWRSPDNGERVKIFEFTDVEMRNYAANLNHGGGERWLAELNVAGNLNERVWMPPSHRIRSFARLPSFFLFHRFLAPFVILTLHDDIILGRLRATEDLMTLILPDFSGRDLGARPETVYMGGEKRKIPSQILFERRA